MLAKHKYLKRVRMLELNIGWGRQSPADCPRIP